MTSNQQHQVNSNSPGNTLAAIDIGTNSVHLVIARPSIGGNMHILETDKITIRLGQYFEPSGNISQKGCQALIKALKHHANLAKVYNCEIRAVATHAMRIAKNKNEILTEIKLKTDIDIEIIDGIEEARLIFLGVNFGLPSDNPSFCIDIGGGSTEFVIGDRNAIGFATSVKLGAVTLSERFLGDQWNNKHISQLESFIDSQLIPIRKQLSQLSFDRVIASAGTAKALAVLHNHLFRGQDPKSDAVKYPNGYKISSLELRQITDFLSDMKSVQKVGQETPLDKSRAEIITAGAVIMNAIMRYLPSKELIVSSMGLREGIVTDTFYRQSRDPSQLNADTQWRAVIDLATRYQIDQDHGHQVMGIAMELYHNLDDVWLNQSDDQVFLPLLRAAAFLHEIGKFIDAPRHHRHASYIMKHSRIPGFTLHEREIIGLIIRFHRKSVPSLDHQELNHLEKADREQVIILSTILRLASAISSGRQPILKSLNIGNDSSGLNISLFFKEDADTEVANFKLKQEVPRIRKGFGTHVTLVSNVDMDLKINTTSKPKKLS